MFNDYHFITRWRVPGTLDDIFAILADPRGLARWWPAVYLDVKVIEKGRADGVGRVVDLLTKGWLPYTLRWRFRITEVNPPRGFSLDAQGDFVGRGIWTLRQDGDTVDITYDWQIRAEKPLLRYLSPLLKPIFSANHHWAMRKGEESLKLELARRQAATPAERSRVPAPPLPTPSPSPVFILGSLAVIGLVAFIALRRLVADDE